MCFSASSLKCRNAVLIDVNSRAVPARLDARHFNSLPPNVTVLCRASNFRRQSRFSANQIAEFQSVLRIVISSTDPYFWEGQENEVPLVIYQRRENLFRSNMGIRISTPKCARMNLSGSTRPYSLVLQS